jgi:hypothetical protein
MLLLMVSVNWSFVGVLASEPKATSEVAVTFFDSNGLSAESAPDHVVELVLFKEHNHAHLKISNTTDHPLVLWQPHCPEGDRAMTIEFRESAAPDKVYRAFAGMNHVYLTGMGLPKTLTLAPSADLIANVDFLNDWSFPFSMNATETRDLEIRVVYRSARLSEEEFKRYTGKDMEKLYGSKELAERVLGTKMMEQVWTGVATSDWEKVRVFNRTGAKVEAR